MAGIVVGDAGWLAQAANNNRPVMIKQNFFIAVLYAKQDNRCKRERYSKPLRAAKSLVQ
jgi:hypothetical protein